MQPVCQSLGNVFLLSKAVHQGVPRSGFARSPRIERPVFMGYVFLRRVPKKIADRSRIALRIFWDSLCVSYLSQPKPFPLNAPRTLFRALPSLAFSGAGRTSKNQIHPRAATRLATRDLPVLEVAAFAFLGCSILRPSSCNITPTGRSPVVSWTLTSCDGWRASPPNKNELWGVLACSLGRAFYSAPPLHFALLGKGLAQTEKASLSPQKPSRYDS